MQFCNIDQVAIKVSAQWYFVCWIFRDHIFEPSAAARDCKKYPNKIFSHACSDVGSLVQTQSYNSKTKGDIPTERVL